MATTTAGAGVVAGAEPGVDAAPAGVGAASGFDPDRPHRISSSVSVRPESFGALVYDFTTRRLSFLKTRLLVAVVEGLAEHDDVHGALDAAGVPDAQRDQYLRALAGLAAARTIVPRDTTPGDTAPTDAAERDA